GDQNDQNPERDRLRQLRPAEFAFGFLWLECWHLLQTRDEWDVSEVLRVVEAVPDQKLVRCVEADESRRHLQLRRDVLVKQGANLQRTRISCRQELDETGERSTAVD